MKRGMAVLFVIAFQLWGCGYLRPISLGSPAPAEVSLEIPAGPGLMAGVGMEPITPEEDVWLGGYYPGRKSTGVRDDLEVRALALRGDDGKLFVLVTLDLMGFLYDDVVRLRQTVHIPGAEVFVMSSHTHSGPDTMGFYGPTLFKVPLLNGRDEGYIDFVIAQSARAIGQALRTLAPVSLLHGSAETELIQSKVEPVADGEVSLLLFQHLDTGKRVAALVNLACSPASLTRENTLISSDFIGPLRDYLDRRLDTTTLFVNGALGRVTYHPSFRELAGTARTEALGRAFGVVAHGISEDARAIADASALSHGRRILHIPLENKRFQLMALLGFVRRSGLGLSGRVETEVNVLRMGEVAIVMVPGEIIPELGLELKRMFGPRTQVWSLANDELGYIVSEEKYDSEHHEYRYARSVSVGPAAAPLIMEAAGKIGLEMSGP